MFKYLLQKIGVDKAIAYSSGSRIVQAVTGPISIIFISRYLTGAEQGFYYTFGSLLLIQTFFELGLSGIITQFVAYEACHLTLNERKIYEGDKRYLSRLSSLLHWSVKWYSIVCLLFFIILNIIGFLYFTKYGNGHDDVSWKIPWVIISIGTSIKLFQSPLNAFITGLGMVKEMNKAMFIQQIILPVASWISLFCGFKLYVLGISCLLSVIFWNVYVQTTHIWDILKGVWNSLASEHVNYMKEIFPLQWRIALSWISGYFVFNIFNVVLFATDGPVVAGQMGMTLQVLNAIQSMGLSWISTKIPLFSSLIAKRNYIQLDHVFKRTTIQMLFILTSMILLMLFGIWILDITQFRIGKEPLINRFLPYIPMILMMIAMLVNDYVNAIATYLRCHKKEPFLWYSIIAGVLSGTSTVVLGKFYGVDGITIGYCTITLLLLFWAQRIYVVCKKKWHITYLRK